MKRIVCGLALAALAVVPAQGVNCPVVAINKGSICQYVTKSGPIRPCIVSDSTNGGLTWNLMIVTSSHTWMAVTNVPNDQSQLRNNSFAVISCEVPF